MVNPRLPEGKRQLPYGVELSTLLHCSGNVPIGYIACYTVIRYFWSPQGYRVCPEATWERNRTLWSRQPSTCAQGRSAISPV